MESLIRSVVSSEAGIIKAWHCGWADDLPRRLAWLTGHTGTTGEIHGIAHEKLIHSADRNISSYIRLFEPMYCKVNGVGT